eukprot:Gb_18100 [translate_table: standard]
MTGNMMFPLKLLLNNSHALKETKDDSWLWHKRYGHLSFQGLSFLHKKKMVKGPLVIQLREEICSGCALGNQHQDSFPVNRLWRAKAPLDFVHANICGDMQTQSLGKNIYFLTFIDDLSCQTWIYFLKQKSEAFKCFKHFKTMVEKQSGYYLKVLRTNREGEFTLGEFSDYCNNHGIKRQLIATCIPQQNGVSERKNCTIMEMERSMLKSKNLPNDYWVEAMAITVYILNHSPTKSMKNITQ